MAKLDSRGFVDDGSPNLTVVGITTVGTLQNTPRTLGGSGNVTVGGPGFYYVPASGSGGVGVFTGSVPAASDYPGSMLVLVDTLGLNTWLLTGSSYAPGKAVFARASGSLPGALPAAHGGSQVAMSPSGSIAMFSDGFRWNVMGGSGSMGLTGLNL